MNRNGTSAPVWLFDLASIAVDAVSRAVARVALWRPDNSCPRIRNRLHCQSVSSSFMVTRLQQTPLAPGSLLPSSLLRGRPTSMHSHGPLRFLDVSFPTRHLQSPRRVQRLLLNVSSALVWASAYLGAWPLSLSVTRPNRVHTTLRLMGSPHGASPSGLLPSDARSASCSTFNLHGNHLSYC